MNVKLRERAEQAEAEPQKARKVIEVQGNVSALLAKLLEYKGARARQSSKNAMYTAVHELTPIIGKRPACQALIHVRHGPCLRSNARPCCKSCTRSAL